MPKLVCPRLVYRCRKQPVSTPEAIYIFKLLHESKFIIHLKVVNWKNYSKVGIFLGVYNEVVASQNINDKNTPILLNMVLHI